jgi:hypothetical protein
MQIKLAGTVREYQITLNDREINDLVTVIENHRGALPEHAERFLSELQNR